jgi:hypothetical protein
MVKIEGMGKKWLYFVASILFPDPKMSSHVMNGYVLVSMFAIWPTLNKMLSEFVFLRKFGW